MEHTQRFLAQMREATPLLQTSGPAAATAAIQRALRGASGAAPPAGKTNADWPVPMLEPHVLVDRNPAAAGSANTAPDLATDLLGRFRQPSWRNRKGTSFRQPLEDVEVD